MLSSTHTDFQFHKKQLLTKINQEFDDYLRSEGTTKRTQVPRGFQDIFNEITNFRKKQQKTLNSLKSQTIMIVPEVNNDTHQNKLNQIQKQFDQKNNAIESQLEMQQQLNNQCGAVQQQIRILNQLTSPLLQIEGGQDRNMNLSQDNFNKIDGMDRQLQSKIFKSKQEINTIEQQQKIYFQHQKDLVDKKMNEKTQLKNQYVDFLYSIEKLKDQEIQQQADINQLNEDEKNIIIRSQEKKATFHSGYTLVKVQGLCQSPHLFEEYFEVVNEDSIDFSLNMSSDSDNSDDVKSLFATAVKIRRKQVPQPPRIARTRMTLKTNFDDEQQIKKIAEECFIIDQYNAQDLVNYLLDEYQDQKVLLQGKCYKYDLMNTFKVQLGQELQEISILLNDFTSQTVFDVDTLYEPNLKFDNFNETVMTFNIKNTSVETILTLQKLEDKVKSSEVLFFHLKGCLGNLLYKYTFINHPRVYSMVQFLNTTKKLSEAIIAYIVKLNDDKVDEYKESLLREKLILEEFKVHSEIDEITLNKFKSQIVSENLMRHYLDRDILRGFFVNVKTNNTLNIPLETLIFDNIHLIKQDCFENLGTDIQRSFSSYADLYILIKHETSFAPQKLSIHQSTQLFKQGDSLMPSPSKQVQRSYQQAATKYKNYYSRDDNVKVGRKIWKIFDMADNSPWKGILKGSQQTLQFLGIDIKASSPRNRISSSLSNEDLYYTFKNRTQSQMLQQQDTKQNKTTENVFHRLNNLKTDQIVEDLKFISNQRETMQKQNDGIAKQLQSIVYQQTDKASVRKLQNFLNQQKKYTTRLLVTAKVNVEKTNSTKSKTIIKVSSVDSFQSTIEKKKKQQNSMSISHIMPIIIQTNDKQNFELKRQVIQRIHNKISNIKTSITEKFNPYLTSQKQFFVKH